jgi:hypothetical protein
MTWTAVCHTSNFRCSNAIAVLKKIIPSIYGAISEKEVINGGFEETALSIVNNT